MLCVLILCHVGTEDGKVYKCSKAYSAHYLDMYEVQIYPFTYHILQSFKTKQFT